jgi:hypothetical protein
LSDGSTAGQDGASPGSCDARSEPRRDADLPRPAPDSDRSREPRNRRAVIAGRLSDSSNPCAGRRSVKNGTKRPTLKRDQLSGLVRAAARGLGRESSGTAGAMARSGPCTHQLTLATPSLDRFHVGGCPRCRSALQTFSRQRSSFAAFRRARG